MSLVSEQPPPSSALPSSPQTQVFQPVSKAPHSSGINVNAAPFQSMQTVLETPWTSWAFGFVSKTNLSPLLFKVFNLNAPVPPASETEALNQANQYQNSYNQAFSSQPQHPVEQSELQSEQLQSGGFFHFLLSAIKLLRVNHDSFFLLNSWSLPFPRPVWRSSTAFTAGPWFQQAATVLLHQSGHVPRGPSECSGGNKRL